MRRLRASLECEHIPEDPPHRLHLSSAASAAEASDIIRAEVYKILEELAAYKYDPEVYARRVRDREGWSELSDDADD